MTAATVLTFAPRKKAEPVPRFYVVRAGGFDGMSRWHSIEQAEIAADDLAEQFPSDKISILTVVREVSA
jgi:hypothetical protein